MSIQKYHKFDITFERYNSKYNRLWEQLINVVIAFFTILAGNIAILVFENPHQELSPSILLSTFLLYVVLSVISTILLAELWATKKIVNALMEKLNS